MLRPWKLEIEFDYNSEKAIYLQIADAIIAGIRSGRLKGGEALPGSRTLADHLQVNRNTAVEALNVLLNEEWLVAKERRGTFVADKLPAFTKRQRTAFDQPGPQDKKDLCRIVFDDGHPDNKIVPMPELARAYRQIFSTSARRMLDYGCEYGYRDFRNAIAHMLSHQRGMQVTGTSVCITRGSQMATYLTAQCLLSSGDAVMIEDPGYRPAWQAFQWAGAHLLPVRVDAEGMLMDDVKKHLKTDPHIKAIYTTPHRQYPTTVTLSLPRRLELIHLSNEYGFTIIEDDYDNEFHFGYRPVLPLSGFPELRNYIYIGTMSKVVAPALRIGYLVTHSKTLMQKIGDLRKIIDVQGDTMMEQAVLQLINDGTIKRHLRKATAHYKEKRNITAGLLDKYLSHKAIYTLPEGGLAFWVVPNTKPNWKQLSEKLRTRHISIITPDAFSFATPANGLRLSYGSPSLSQLEEGIKAIATLL